MKGCLYHDLPDTFVIFVCDFDYFGAGLAVYERECRVKGTDIPYDDGTRVFILNSRYKQGNSDRAILESLDYIRTNDAQLGYQSELAQKIVNRVSCIHQDERMEGIYMSTELYELEIREKGRLEGRQEGRQEGMESALLSSIRNLTDTMHLTVEQAMSALRVPMEDRARLSALLSGMLP